MSWQTRCKWDDVGKMKFWDASGDNAGLPAAMLLRMLVCANTMSWALTLMSWQPRCR
jgi:hypothetical protein